MMDQAELPIQGRFPRHIQPSLPFLFFFPVIKILLQKQLMRGKVSVSLIVQATVGHGVSKLKHLVTLQPQSEEQKAVTVTG